MLDPLRLLSLSVDKQHHWKLIVLAHWAEIAGPLAAHARIERIGDGVIEIGTLHPLWAQEFSFRAEEIKDRINEILGDEVIDAIRISGVQRGSKRPKNTGLSPSLSLLATTTQKSHATLTPEECARTHHIMKDHELSQSMLNFYLQCKRRVYTMGRKGNDEQEEESRDGKISRQSSLFGDKSVCGKSVGGQQTGDSTIKNRS